MNVSANLDTFEFRWIILLGYSGHELTMEPAKAELDKFLDLVKKAQNHPAKVEQIGEFMESPAEDVFKLRSDVNDKFF